MFAIRFAAQLHSLQQSPLDSPYHSFNIAVGLPASSSKVLVFRTKTLNFTPLPLPSIEGGFCLYQINIRSNTVIPIWPRLRGQLSRHDFGQQQQQKLLQTGRGALKQCSTVPLPTPLKPISNRHNRFTIDKTNSPLIKPIRHR